MKSKKLISPIRAEATLSRISRTTSTSNLWFIFSICLAISTFFFIITFSTTKIDINSTSVAPRRIGELPTWGYNRSLCLRDYINPNDSHSFILQPQRSKIKFCQDNQTRHEQLQLLIMVTSSPMHSKEREVIRETWASHHELETYSAQLFFFLGTSQNYSVDEELEKEYNTYGDLVVDDYIDAYHNLTLKSASMFKWFTLTCSSAQNGSSYPIWVLKTDDDIFINLKRLFEIVKIMPNAKMIGRLICGAEPISDSKSKLFMPEYLYPGRVYPGYLSGTGYLIRGELIPRIFDMAFTVPIIHMEDIYITGLVASKLKIYPEDSAYFTYLNITSNDLCILKEMVNSHGISINEMNKIWGLWKNSTLTESCTNILTPKVRKKKFRRPAPPLHRMSKRLKKICLFPVS